MARLLALVVAAAAVVLVVATPAAAQGGGDDGDAPAYRNHTVGGADGWFFDAKTNTSSGNYSDWANGETFYLGDYLSMLIHSHVSPLLLRFKLVSLPVSCVHSFSCGERRARKSKNLVLVVGATERNDKFCCYCLQQLDVWTISHSLSFHILWHLAFYLAL